MSDLSVTGGNIVVFGAFEFPVLEIEPGSWTAPLEGTLTADLQTDSIALLTDTNVRATDHTAYLPGMPSDPGVPAPGSFGLLFPSAPALGIDIIAVTRDLTFSLEDASAKTIAAGEFDASSTVWTVASGVADLNAGMPPQSDLTTVAPVTSVPTSAGTIGDDGSTQTLTIPVDFTLVIDAADSVISLNYEGTVVATRPLNDCAVDLDGDGLLTVFDFLEFQNLFASGGLAADFDGDGELTLFDFLAFQNLFDAGCP